MYKFEFTLSESDYMEFNRFHTESSWLNRKVSQILPWIIPVLFAFMFIRSFYRIDHWRMGVIMGMLYLGIGAAFFVGIKYLEKALTKPTLKLMMFAVKRDGKLPYAKNVRMEFWDDHVIEINELAETKVKYTTMERVAVGPKGVYIYMTAISALLLPMFAFESEAQRDELVAFVREKLPPPKSGKSKYHR